MSAECWTHGCDLVYPPGSWPSGVCRVCELEAQKKRLEEELVEEQERLDRLIERMESDRRECAALLAEKERLEEALEQAEVLSLDSAPREWIDDADLFVKYTAWLKSIGGKRHPPALARDVTDTEQGLVP